MTKYIQTASRAELRQFSSVFRTSWDAILNALFRKCNNRSDEILRQYESWYTESTQAVFDDMYRKDLFSFVRRRRFWEVFLVIGAIAGCPHYSDRLGRVAPLDIHRRCWRWRSGSRS